MTRLFNDIKCDFINLWIDYDIWCFETIEDSNSKCYSKIKPDCRNTTIKLIVLYSSEINSYLPSRILGIWTKT